MDTKHTLHLWKSHSQEHFHRWSDHYDEDIINVLLFYPSFRRVAERLRHWRRRGAEKFRVLDIGCGTGNLAFYCLEYIKSVEEFMGLDMSESMIAKARQKHDKFGNNKKVSFVVGDAEHLPFPDNSFNIITCCNSFHHYPYQKQTLKEICRVLRPNGFFLLLDSFLDNPLRKQWGKFLIHFFHEPSAKYHTRESLRELCNEKEIKLLKQEPFLYFILISIYKKISKV